MKVHQRPSDSVIDTVLPIISELGILSFILHCITFDRHRVLLDFKNCCAEQRNS